MEQSVLIEYLYVFMITAGIIAGVPLAIATVLGVLVSLFQATTQIQDQTLSQTVRIIAISIVLLMSGSSLFSPLLITTNRIFEALETIGR